MSNKIEKRLLIVDASSFLYRAFHALPDLRNKRGEPTGALFGIINMLKKVRIDWPSQVGACIFDPKGPTFRSKIYPDYKATRSSMPDDLSKQIPPIFEVVKALGWPFIQVDGYEADDVIGTIVTSAEEQGFNSVIISGDKDLTQLVNEKTILVDTMSRHGGSGKVYDLDAVKEKFGVFPNQIIDFLTLVGDQSDNIPGVEKVGPKTASKLISQYGSVDNIIKASGSIKGVVGKNLIESKEWIPTGKNLVTIRKNCPKIEKFINSIEQYLQWQEIDFEKIAYLKKEYELDRVLGNISDSLLPKNSGGDLDYSKKQSSDTYDQNDSKKYDLNYETILDQNSLNKLLKKISNQSLVAFDTETTSLNTREAKLVGISFSWEVGSGAYIPVAHVNDDENGKKQIPVDIVIKMLKPWFENPNISKLAHNLKYDQHILENYGVTLNGILHDTLLQSYVLEAHRRHDLESLAKRYLNREGLTYDQLTGKGKKRIGFEEVSIKIASQYSCEDSDFTLDLHKKLLPLLEQDSKLLEIYREFEIPSLQILKEMESCGVPIDTSILQEQTASLKKQIILLEKKAFKFSKKNFNLASPKQISEILFKDLGYKPVKKTASGAPSTDESVLERLAENYPLPKVLLEWRTLSKLKSTYTEKLPKMIDPYTKRLHTTFSQATAVTGRLASSDPNLQNIPVKTEEGRKIRSAFIAGKNKRIISADYSQIELRIMAHLSEDTRLIDAFDKGLDVHSETASEIFGVGRKEVNNLQRRTAKIINFGLIYGMSAFGLSKSLDISIDAAKLYIDKYFVKYPGVADFMTKTKIFAKKNGYVETVFGRRLWLPEISSPNGPRRQASERAAINAPMQGTAADLIKLAMIKTRKMIEKNKFNSNLILQVHDELIFETPVEEVEFFVTSLNHEMTNVANLRIPLEVDVGIGKNWEEAH